MRSTRRQPFHARVLPVGLCLMLLPGMLSGDESLRAKLGQMIVVGFLGQTVPDSLFLDLSQRNLGGVIVSGANGNLANPGQIRSLTAALRNAASTPPFVAVDQEGGRVARLNASNGFASTNTAYILGTTYASLDSTRAQATLMAGWVKDCGMNLNLAPVLDVNVNPASPAIGYYGRSFSSDPAVVAAHSRVFIEAFHDRGLMTATKHFPGHGSASTDSHLTLPDITLTWSESELTPYRELLATNSLDVVMVGHLYHSQIDSVYPTSLSTNAIQGLLRDSLRYQGVVVTDAMGMTAITANYGLWDAAELAVNAGVDILLYTSNLLNNASLVRQLVDSLEARVLRGRIAEARITEAYGRVMALKNRYLVTGVRRPTAGTVPSGHLLTNYPNPFNPATTISFALPVRSRVTIRVYDLLGRLVETLVDGDVDAGSYTTRWNPVGLSSGVYICRLDASSAAEGWRETVEMKKMLYMR